MEEKFEFKKFLGDQNFELIYFDEKKHPFIGRVDPFGMAETTLDFKYYQFGDYHFEAMDLNGVIFGVTEKDLMLFQCHVISNRRYTHTRNRKSWTGPHLHIYISDENGFIFEDWDAGQANFTCSSSYIYRKEKTVLGLFSKIKSLKFGTTSFYATPC